LADVPTDFHGSAGGLGGVFVRIAQRQQQLGDRLEPPGALGGQARCIRATRVQKAKIEAPKNMATYSDVIPQLVQRIVDEVRPLRIIIFGSGARGEMGPDSDIDILVVMPDGTHRRRTAQLLYRKIRGAGVPFDVLVATPSDLEKHRDNIGLIYRTILEEGKEVYAA
jgi:predicted nucleotidyltransferase